MIKPIILATLVLGPFSASAMSFKAQIQPLKLPLMISTTQPPKVKFTPPGEISVGLMRMCGDGDVAHFEQEHPEFDFVPQTVTNLHVLVGYWVVEADSTNPVPSSANFYPIGYRKNEIAEGPTTIKYEGKFLPINKSFSPGPNGLNLMAMEILNLHKVAKESFGAQKDYRIFAGASTCVTPAQESALADASSSGFTYTPSPVEILHTLTSTGSGQLLDLANSAANDLDASEDNKVNQFVNKYDKVKFTMGDKNESIYKDNTTYIAEPGKKPYRYDIGNHGESMTSLQSFAIMEEIAKLDYPTMTGATDADKLLEYRNTMTALSTYSKVSGIDSMAKCKSVANIDVNGAAPQYKWEAFPMNLSCKHLLSNGQLQNKVTELFKPDTLPDQAKFDSLKKDLAKRFFVASVFETAQKALHASSSVKIERPNCFNTSGSQKLIHRLVGSYPFEFKKTAGAYKINPSAYNHVHPEPLFALVDYTRYFSDDRVGVWGQVLPASATPDPEAWGMKFPLKNQDWSDNEVDSSTFNGVPININFKIRSVGGSCPMFC